jgi:predicted DNA-binding ribbon-helix-helix protein
VAAEDDAEIAKPTLGNVRSTIGAGSAIVKRSVTIAGHATSISLEEPFWRCLSHIAGVEGVSVSALLRRIDTKRSATDAKINLSSAVRLFVLDWLAKQAGVDLTG